MKFTSEQDRLEGIAEYARNLVTIIDQPRRDTPIGEATHARSYVHAVDLLREALDSLYSAAAAQEGKE